MRTFRVSRIRGDIRFATRRERDFRLPPEFDVDALPRPAAVADRRRRRRGADRGRRRHRLVGRAHVRRRRRSRTASSSRSTRASPLLASWVLRQDGRAVPLDAGRAAARGRARAASACASAHEGEPPKLAREARRARERRRRRAPGRRRSRPSASAVLQALLAYLLAACGEDAQAEIPAAELVERFHIPSEELEEHLSLLNLVNFGGGCYAVYAELDGDEVHVDKELFGDTFRRAAAADAARGARDPARARVRRADDRGRGAHAARARAREARGDLRRVRARADARAAGRQRAEEDLVAHAQPTAIARAARSSRSST